MKIVILVDGKDVNSGGKKISLKTPLTLLAMCCISIIIVCDICCFSYASLLLSLLKGVINCRVCLTLI